MRDSLARLSAGLLSVDTLRLAKSCHPPSVLAKKSLSLYLARFSSEIIEAWRTEMRRISISANNELVSLRRSCGIAAIFVSDGFAAGEPCHSQTS